jgi:hypothetical protein
MTVIVDEQFTGLEAGSSISGRTPSPTNTPGNTWTGVTNVVGATGGNAMRISTSNGRCFLDVGTPDCRADAVRSNGSQEHTLLVRASSPGLFFNAYALYCNGGVNVVRIARFTGGGRTDLQSYAPSLGASNKLGLEVSGTGATVTLKWYLNDALMGTITDESGSRLTSGNYVGFNSDFGAGDWDNLTVDDLISGGGGGDALGFRPWYTRTSRGVGGGGLA